MPWRISLLCIVAELAVGGSVTVAVAVGFIVLIVLFTYVKKLSGLQYAGFFLLDFTLQVC